MPFRNLKPDADTDFLGFSLADEVIAKLGYVKALTVRPSSAINRLPRRGDRFAQSRGRFECRHAPHRNYLKDGDDLRITARLIGFNPDAVLWQDTWDMKC